jgi:RNA polymerase sigma factor (TIGR02999 family)
MSDVTRLLDATAAGDRNAAAELLPLVYTELRRLAAARMAAEPPDHTLQPTALVHEAYLRLVGPKNDAAWDGRGHFFAAAAEAMRRILIEAARSKGREKRGGVRIRIPLEEVDLPAPELHEDVVALDSALEKLANSDPQAAELVRLRYFAGVTLAEGARILGVSPRSADRLWAYARAWLYHEVRG